MINYLTGNIKSDEWYTPLEVVKFIKNNVNLEGKKIICPFDTKNSNFSKIFKGSINCINDFMQKDYDYDICITNPPFSFRDKVIRRCLNQNKDIILIFPENAIFSVTFYNLRKEYDFHYKIFSPKKRIYFIDQNGNQNRPNFHSVILYINKNFKENTIEHIDLENFED
jgi:hypothetical protein